MDAQSINSFEQSILNSSADLSHFEKSAPLKTAEEIRRDWLLERIGKFTASEFHRLTTAPTKKELPVGAITYVQEKVTEEQSSVVENFQNPTNNKAMFLMLFGLFIIYTLDQSRY